MASPLVIFSTNNRFFQLAMMNDLFGASDVIVKRLRLIRQLNPVFICFLDVGLQLF
jgi:hypothetical protein